MFFLLGVIGASWISRIPAVQADLHLGNGELGAVLVGMPLGSVAVSLALPSLVARFGSRAVVSVALPVSAATLVLPGLATGAATLAAALAVLGAATAGLDVAMNTHGVQVERAHGRSVFSRLHALWSLGGFVGAGAGVLFQRAGIDPAAHLALVAVITAVVGLPVTRVLDTADPPPVDTRHRGWSRDRTVLALAAVCIAAFVVEVVAADWGGVYLRRDIGTATSTAAGAYAAFALPHFAVRVVGDPLVDRLAARPLLATALLTSAAGFVLVVAGGSAWVVFAGLAVSGAGIGLVVPVAFAAAGRVPGIAAGAGVATAAGLSYVAWTVAPAAVGGIAAAGGLRLALLLAPAAAVVAALTLTRARTV